MLFGEGMKNERKRLKLSQSELSAKSSVSQQTISAIERGASEPTEHTMVMIAHGLGCTVGKLLGECDTKTDAPKSTDALFKNIAEAINGLPVTDLQRVLDFVAGLRSARMEPPSVTREDGSIGQ